MRRVTYHPYRKRVYCTECGRDYPKDICGRNGMGQILCPDRHQVRVKPKVRTGRVRHQQARVTVQDRTANGPILPKGWTITSNYTPIPVEVLYAYFSASHKGGD
jgi:hypothetical protein